MSLQLAPKLVTLSDLEGPSFCIISPISAAFGPITSKWLKIDLYYPVQKCSPKKLDFSDVSFMASIHRGCWKWMHYYLWGHILWVTVSYWPDCRPFRRDLRTYLFVGHSKQ